VVVVVGLTCTDELLPRLSDHAYVGAPEAVSVVLVPLQIAITPPIEATGRLFTVTVAVSVSVQLLPSVTVTV
jgi:hypothetical protein